MDTQAFCGMNVCRPVSSHCNVGGGTCVNAGSWFTGANTVWFGYATTPGITEAELGLLEQNDDKGITGDGGGWTKGT